MLKTKLFARATVNDVFDEYEKFLKENQDIKIISVNTMYQNKILLTYETNS